MKKQTMLLVVIVVATLLLVSIFVAISKKQASTDKNSEFFQGKQNLLANQESKLKPIVSKSYSVANGKMAIGIGIGGVGDAQGVSALALNFSNLPDYLTNPKIQIADSTWNTNQSKLENGSVKFVANNINKPLTADADNFAVIAFDLKGNASLIQSHKSNIEIEIIDTSMKAESYTFNREIEIIAK